MSLHFEPPSYTGIIALGWSLEIDRLSMTIPNLTKWLKWGQSRVVIKHDNFVIFLAHLSPSSSVHIFKDLLLQNCLVNLSKILCGDSLGRRNESLFAASGSHEQDGRHAHIW